MRIFLAWVLVVSAPVVAKTFELSCPSKIQTKQEIVAPPRGWDVLSFLPALLDAPLEFASEHRGWVDGFSGGHPKERAILMPDNTTLSKKNKLSVSTWFFSKSEENWVICKYKDTVFELSKPLPAGLKQCSIQYNEATMVVRAWCD